ncbi:MAG: ATP-binding protein [Leptospiraceae bacterium]|nr:ATP-binding protein [Leptospiraceae bacterium]
MSKTIGKVAATEKIPNTIDEFYFWTSQDRILNPFDIIKVEHIKNSITFGVVEEISHITDSPSYLSSFVSSDFGEIDYKPNMNRIGMNFVKAKVISNTQNIYTPVLDGHQVSLASREEIEEALGLSRIKNKLACGYIQMYKNEAEISVPVFLDSQFLIGPEGGAHLNISGISGLASKTSYTMFLIKAIQQKYLKMNSDNEDSIAFILFNVKGRDLLAINQVNNELSQKDKDIYEMLSLDCDPFGNVKYFYPYSPNNTSTYVKKEDLENQLEDHKAYFYKYIYEYDKNNLDLLFANVEDSTGTMDQIINFIISKQDNFGNIQSWQKFLEEVTKYCEKGNKIGKGEIPVTSWRKFKRNINKALHNPIFAGGIQKNKNEIRLRESIRSINKNDIFVIDVAKLDSDTQSFVFGDVTRAVWDLKLGQYDEEKYDLKREDKDIPSKIVIFIDELNKYASKDSPKDSPVLRQILDITERGRSLGVVLFSAEQFRSSIHDRVKGNCATHAYGRTNVTEITKPDYSFIPNVYKNMLTRLEQGEYIIQNPVFRSLLNIKFPREVFRRL